MVFSVLAKVADDISAKRIYLRSIEENVSRKMDRHRYERGIAVTINQLSCRYYLLD